MKKGFRREDPLLWVLLLVSALLLLAPMYAENDVMGEIQFEGKSHVEKTSGKENPMSRRLLGSGLTDST